METLNEILIWILEIGAAVIIILGALLWLKAAQRSQSTARSFMALVFSFVFFIVVILRSQDFNGPTLKWMIIVYGAVQAFYIVARMIEHREEIKSGQTKKVEKPSE